MSADSVVRTTAGLVRGRPWRVGTAFLGLPYAEPPYGENRFRAPVPRRPWAGVLDCVAYGATPQRRSIAEVTAIPEPSIAGDDVLSLNVFTPGAAGPDAAGPGLPVLFYVHGGGYVAGSPASPWYDGAAFVRDGVVVVTVAYRLAFEGFGHLPDAPDDRGLLDLVLALEWVRDNIAAFGGDPARVTIAGQSAGGGAVMHLLVSPAAKGLFAGVIAISGAPGDRTPDDAAAETADLAGRLGVSPDAAGFSSVPELDLVAAQGIGAAFDAAPTVDGIVGTVRALATGLRMAPVVDGALLPEPVAAALGRGVGADVPLLVGATRDEFSGLALAAGPLLDDLDPVELLTRTGLEAGTAARYAAALAGRTASQVLGQAATDLVFRRRVVQWAALRSAGTAPTFVYDFAWRSGADGLSGHCLDVPFAWDVLADGHVARVAGDDPPQALADAVHGAYVAFVRDGDPGWSRWDGTGPVMTWDEECRLDDDSAFGSARLVQ